MGKSKSKVQRKLKNRINSITTDKRRKEKIKNKPIFKYVQFCCGTNREEDWTYFREKPSWKISLNRSSSIWKDTNSKWRKIKLKNSDWSIEIW